jgi:hypothetical protein
MCRINAVNYHTPTDMSGTVWASQFIRNSRFGSRIASIPVSNYLTKGSGGEGIRYSRSSVLGSSFTPNRIDSESLSPGVLSGAQPPLQEIGLPPTPPL